MNTHKTQSRRLSVEQESGIKLCRIATGLVIMADGCWFLASHETRSAYFKQLGVPTFFVYVIALVYLFIGLGIVINRAVGASCFTMLSTIAVIMFVLHTPVGPGGIGDYPRELHNEFNLLQLLKYVGMAGTVFIIYGFVDFERRGGIIMEGTQSYAIVLGRAAIGIHFLVENFWFRLVQHELRSKQVIIMGGRPFIQVWSVGLLYVVFGYLIWLGNSKFRKFAAVCSGVLTLLLVTMDRNSLTMTVGIYNMKVEAAFHHFVINLGIIIGCLLIYFLGDKPVEKYKSSD